MTRGIILLLDSFGIGYGEDAGKFKDEGADTLGHIVRWYSEHHRTLQLPNMAKLGLGLASQQSTGHKLEPSIGGAEPLQGAYTYAKEISSGKDTLSGHWEITGVPVKFDWGYFPNKPNCFPKELVDKLVEEGRLTGVLGEKHASGTEIIKELGLEHIKSGKPIVYTSADSVLQIAAHEKYFGLDRLYKLCELAYELVKPYKIARVIARPFVGETPEDFVRTGNRHDYAVPAPDKTLLDYLTDSGGSVYAVGKISDIFAHRGITKGYHATGLPELFDTTLAALKEAGDRSLVFTNFVDFDSSYGHRRDVEGYGQGLEYIDKRLPEILQLLHPGDLLLITADHGCDPTWRGNDHTREHIPVLFTGPEIIPGPLKPMETFSDIGQIMAKHLQLQLPRGTAQEVEK